MDKLDGLIHWASGIDRSAQFEVIRRLTAIAPGAMIAIPSEVNDPKRSPAAAVLNELARWSPTPLQRDGLFLALASWLDVLMRVDGATFSEQIQGVPIRAATGSAAPVTDEVLAAFMPHQMMAAAKAANQWASAVGSWKEFRRGAT